MMSFANCSVYYDMALHVEQFENLKVGHLDDLVACKISD